MSEFENATKYRERKEAEFEDALEAAFWEFDARRKGLSIWKGMPQSERDAFKAAVRNLGKL